jgi:hypothetical protein
MIDGNAISMTCLLTVLYQSCIFDKGNEGYTTDMIHLNPLTPKIP